MLVFESYLSARFRTASRSTLVNVVRLLTPFFFDFSISQHVSASSSSMPSPSSSIFFYKISQKSHQPLFAAENQMTLKLSRWNVAEPNVLRADASLARVHPGHVCLPFPLPPGVPKFVSTRGEGARRNRGKREGATRRRKRGCRTTNYLSTASSECSLKLGKDHEGKQSASDQHNARVSGIEGKRPTK